MGSSSRRWLLSTTLLLGLVLPFAGKPVHIDDANFLVLARGARLDFWRPHAVTVNWQGSTERAFDVLSNPPGIGWWLAPVVEAPEWVLHLWMVPWLLLTALGAHRLGRRFGGDGPAAVLLLGTSPIVLLAAQGLTPDLPLLALTVIGLGGYLSAVDQARPRAAAGWALVAGGAVLFRYSGLCLVPLLVLYPLLVGRRPWPGLVGLLPLSLLLLHDLHAYGELHVLAMAGFQSTNATGWESARKLVAALAMLGAAGLLPVVALLSGWRALIPGLLGAILGLLAAQRSGLGFGVALWTAACTGAGGAVLLGALRGSRTRGERVDQGFLLAWALGGLCFLLVLRFTAARYWLPFLPALVLLWLRTAPGRTVLVLAVGLQVLLAVGLSLDDAAMARAGRDAAEEVNARAEVYASWRGEGAGERVFAGHWGWQHYLERQGWRSIEDEERLPAGALFATASAPWPQEPDPGTCLELLWEAGYAAEWSGPRVYSAAGAANLHAFEIAGSPPLETYVPWTLASDERERVRLYAVCE